MECSKPAPAVYVDDLTIRQSESFAPILYILPVLAVMFHSIFAFCCWTMLNHQQVPHLFRPSSMEKILQQPLVNLMITTCSPLWCDVSTRALSEASPRFDAPNHVREHSVEVRRHRQGKTRPFQQALQNELLEVHNPKVKERQRENISTNFFTGFQMVPFPEGIPLTIIWWYLLKKRTKNSVTQRFWSQALALQNK